MFKGAMEVVKRRWLRYVANATARRATAHIKQGNSGRRSSRSKARVKGISATSKRAVVKALESINQPGYTKRIKIPPGGFKKPGAWPTGWPMEKPEGLIFRRTTYNRKAGQIVEFPGFFSKAIEQVFQGSRGRKTFNNIADPVALLALNFLVNALVHELRTRGTIGGQQVRVIVKGGRGKHRFLRGIDLEQVSFA